MMDVTCGGKLMICFMNLPIIFLLMNTTSETEIVNAWTVKGDVNGQSMYDRLINQFGCEPITKDLKERFERLSGRPMHTWLRRNLFFAHRNLSQILDDYEKGIPIYLYTGRGPTSESLHIGHVIAMQFCQYLQEVFKAFVVFQIADDEKYYFKENLSYEQICKFGYENCKDLAALGFDPARTFIFFNREQMREEVYQKVGADFKKAVSIKHIGAIFGLDENASIGQFEWPIQQIVPAFSQAFDHFKGSSKFNCRFPADSTPIKSTKEQKGIRCLIVYAIDQDPYFRLARELASKFGYQKPCSIMCRFLPALEGDAKMSSSISVALQVATPTESARQADKNSQADKLPVQETASISSSAESFSTTSTTSTTSLKNGEMLPPKPKTIFLTSSPKEIRTMISGAFSGGGDTLELHRKNGGNPDVDVPFQLLRYFLPGDDDAELDRLYHGYKDGTVTSGEMKKRCIEVITAFVEDHKRKRALVTDEIMHYYYAF